MKVDALRQEGYELLHNGCVELAQVEANGIRVDLKRLESTKLDLQTKLRALRQSMEQEAIWRQWRKRFGEKAKLTSRDQLAVMLPGVGIELEEQTETGRWAMDEEVLQKMDHPFVNTLIRFLKYDKALGTFLKGIEREIHGDRLHPVFNLHLARSYRSSSDSPNFQNMPVRDKEISEIIRSLLIPSRHCVLVENDFKGIEVSVSACYHKDPNFISYITTPGKDMHRDMAAQLYKTKPGEVSKEMRYGAKNKFVFPQFYGDFYVSCARSLWEWITKGKLDVKGDPLKAHLARHGIAELGACDPEQDPEEGTFEAHVREVENDFWNNRFRAYGRWRKEWYQTYLDKGYFDLLTGFRISGFLSRNQVTNLPIQGSAFHCLLWSLIRINRLLRKYNMRSKVVGQIHDSLIGDVRADELGDYLELVEQVTTVDLRKHYSWLIVPLEIEYEMAPLGGNWFQKREFKFKQGKFYHPKHPTRFTRDSERWLEILKQNHE